jgi:hypothetical protein
MRSIVSKMVLPLLLFAFCLAVYYATLAPSITWKNDGVDSGDLVTAAYTMGIAHPPGYPLFMLLAKLFTLLPVGEVAYRVNLMSAILAAFTIAVVYYAILLLCPRGIDTPSKVIIAAASALLLGMSRTLWSQAIIAEVYSLHALITALIVLFTTLYRRTKHQRWLWLLGLVLGLGLSNHLSTFLLVPGTLYLALNVEPPRPRAYLGMGAFLLLGLSTYLYLPLRAAQYPPLNWGAPHTWSGFWWTVSARIYGDYALGVPLIHLPVRTASWLSMLSQQFGWVGFTLGLVGLWDLWEKDREWLAFSLISFAAVVTYSITYNTTDSYVYLIPSYLLFAFWLARGASYLILEILQPWTKKGRDAASCRSRPTWPITLALLVLPILALGANYSALDLSNDTEASGYAAQVFAQTTPDALIIADTDGHIFSLWYQRYVQAAEPAPVVVAKSLLQYRWYKDTLRWNHPEVIIPDSEGAPHDQLIAFIDANLPHRPIYLTDPDDQILDHYAFSRVGTLYRLGVKG